MGNRMCKRVSKLPVDLKVYILLFVDRPEFFEYVPKEFLTRSGFISALDRVNNFERHLPIWLILCTKHGVDITGILSARPVVGCGRIAKYMSNKFEFRELLPHMSNDDILMYIMARFKGVPHMACGHSLSANFGDKHGAMDTSVTIYTDDIGRMMTIIAINGDIRAQIGGTSTMIEYVKNELNQLGKGISRLYITTSISKKSPLHTYNTASSSSDSVTTDDFSINVDLDITKKKRYRDDVHPKLMSLSMSDLRRVDSGSFYYLSPRGRP